MSKRIEVNTATSVLHEVGHALHYQSITAKVDAWLRDVVQFQGINTVQLFEGVRGDIDIRFGKDDAMRAPTPGTLIRTIADGVSVETARDFLRVNDNEWTGGVHVWRGNALQKGEAAVQTVFELLQRLANTQLPLASYANFPAVNDNRYFSSNSSYWRVGPKASEVAALHSYCLKSPADFFAVCYELYYSPMPGRREQLPQWVRDFFVKDVDSAKKYIW